MPGNIIVLNQDYVMSLPGVPPRTFVAGEQVQPHSRHYYPLLWAGVVTEGGSPGITAPPELAGLSGSGRPEGVVTATIGNLYYDTAVTNGASLWQKISGSGNTGWQVVRGDTGRRNITSLCTFNPGGAISAGTVYIRRINDTVWIHLNDVQFSGIASTASFDIPLAAGFRSNAAEFGAAFALSGGAGGGGNLQRADAFGGDAGYALQSVTNSTRLRDTKSFPSTLSGTNWQWPVGALPGSSVAG